MELGRKLLAILQLNGHRNSLAQTHPGSACCEPSFGELIHCRSTTSPGTDPQNMRRYDLLRMLDTRRQQPVSPPHHGPVVLISRPTSQAYLIIAAVFAAARPRKSVRTTTSEKLLQEIQWVTP